MPNNIINTPETAYIVIINVASSFAEENDRLIANTSQAINNTLHDIISHFLLWLIATISSVIARAFSIVIMITDGIPKGILRIIINRLSATKTIDEITNIIFIRSLFFMESPILRAGIVSIKSSIH